MLDWANFGVNLLILVASVISVRNGIAESRERSRPHDGEAAPSSVTTIRAARCSPWGVLAIAFLLFVSNAAYHHWWGTEPAHPPDLRRPLDKQQFIEGLEAFARQNGYQQKRVVAFCLKDDKSSCTIAHEYLDTIRLASGWSTAWGGPLAPAHGVYIQTLLNDQVDVDPKAQASSPWGLWHELTLEQVSGAGWYLWPLSLPANSFALVVGSAPL
jgi:hypothetical protein